MSAIMVFARQLVCTGVSFAPKAGIEVAKCLSLLAKRERRFHVLHLSTKLGWKRIYGLRKRAPHNTSHPTILQNLSMASFAIRTHFLNHDLITQRVCFVLSLFPLHHRSQTGRG